MEHIINCQDGEFKFSEDEYQNLKIVYPSLEKSYLISKHIFSKFIEFSNHYNQSDKQRQKYLDNIDIITGYKVRGQEQKEVYEWCMQFISNITNPDDIMSFTETSKDLGNDSVYTLACFIIARDIEQLSLDDMREKYQIKNDLSQEEIDQLKREDEIYMLLNK